MTAFPADILPDEGEERSGWNDAISAVLLVISVLVWTCFWGVVWLSSLVYVALHPLDDQGAQPRIRFPRRVRRA
jgi:hypothetical protein